MKKASLKVNAISNWASLFVQIAVGLFLTPFIISHLGKSGYGIWVLVGSFTGYYGLLNLGVKSAVTRYIARYSAQNDTKNLNEVINTALLMFCITCFLAIVISFLIAGPLARFFKVAPEHFREFKYVVWVLGISTGLSFPCGVFSTMITARERYVALNVVNIAAALLRAGLMVVILLSGHGLAGIACSALAATVVSTVSFIVLSRRIVPEFKFQLSNANLATFRMILVFGGFTTIIAIGDILRLKIDSVVIGRMIGIDEVGIYGVAALFVGYMLALVTSGTSVLTPRFAALDGADNHQELRNIFLRSLSVSSFIACGIAVPAVLFGRSFLFLYVGSGFEAAGPVLILLATSYAFALSQAPGIGAMYALNKHRFYAAATITEAVTNVLLSIMLAPRYGILGVALGTAIPMISVKFFVQPVYVSRIVGIRLRDYAKAIAPAFGTSLIILVVVYVLRHFSGFVFDIQSYHVLAIWLLITGAVYLLLNCYCSSNVRLLILSFLPKTKNIKVLLL